MSSMQLSWYPASRLSGECMHESVDLSVGVRAEERIDVASGGVVPGPADFEPLPDPSTDPPDAAELAAGWLAWWQSLTEMPPLSPPFHRSHPPGVMAFRPPGFPGLPGWPVLPRRVGASRVGGA